MPENRGLNRLLEMQASRIELELEWIEERMKDLGASEEEEAERIILENLKDSLLEDLKKIKALSRRL